MDAARLDAVGAEFLVGFLDFVVVTPANAGHFAGLLDVLQFFGQGQLLIAETELQPMTEFQGRRQALEKIGQILHGYVRGVDVGGL